MKRAVAAIIRQGNQILLCRRSLSSRNQPGKWENPGGEIDPNETPGEAIVLEIREELGVKFIPAKIIYEDNFKSEDDTWQVTIFAGSIIGTPQALIPEETIEVCWFDITLLNQIDLASYTRADFVRLGWLSTMA